MNPLHEAQIRDHIHDVSFNDQLEFHVLKTIGSTNQYLKEITPTENMVICCAETQTQGRGRFGRSWHSPWGENIYCSVRIPVHGDLTQLSGLSLVVSLSVIETLRALYPEEAFKIKWPNDVLWQQKKLSGCLIELMTAHNANPYVIMGIGINVNATIANDTPWCSLRDITGQLHDRNKILGRLIPNLHQAIQSLWSQGFTTFSEQWQGVDALMGHAINVFTLNEHLNGRANGVDAQGRLMLVDEKGQPHYLSAGEASLTQPIAPLSCT